MFFGTWSDEEGCWKSTFIEGDETIIEDVDADLIDWLSVRGGIRCYEGATLVRADGHGGLFVQGKLVP